MPYMYEVIADFERDWTNFLCRQLTEAGYTPDRSLGADEIGYRYFNLQRRLIPAVPRKILKSDVFSCPDYLKDGLELLEQKIRSGASLLPHLSRKTGSLIETDSLLNDWGIHHLHLGNRLQDDGLVNRTGPILFARFDQTHAYFICIMEHGRGHSPWYKQQMIQILHRNWPESIEHFRLKELKGLSRPVTDEDIKKNRKYGSYCFTEPEPGVVYAPFGGGYSTVGTSVEAGSLSDTWLNAIWNSEKYLRENIARIVKLVYDETGKQIGPKMKFLLGIEGRDIYALEVQSRVFLKLDSI